MMEKRGRSGGFITVSSLVNSEDRKSAGNARLAMASSSIMRLAAKEGLLSLYADAEEVLDKYKDFDIVASMREHKGKLLWVRARAIDADVANANGDYFSEEELLGEVVDQKGNKMPAYKTFEGVPIYTNHKNDDIEQAKGMVVYSEWDDKEKCVYCTFIVDEEAYPEIARGIRVGYMHDVSMGCFDGMTKIPTSNGFKAIKDVKDTDLLLDKDGKFVEIVNRQEYDHYENIHLITLEGGFQIKCTFYHPFLVHTKEQWAARKSLKRPVVTGRKTSEWVKNEIVPSYIRTEDLKPGDIFLSPVGGVETKDVDFNINRARLVGYFLAEGSYDSNKLRKRSIFTFNINESETLGQEIVDLLKLEFGVLATKNTYDKQNYCQVRVTSSEVYDWFYENCGQYSKTKKLHPKWLTAPLDIQLQLLAAYIDGDGSVTTDKRTNSQYLRVSTISRELYEQVSFMLTRLGIHHSIYFAHRGKRFSHSELDNITDVNVNHVIQIPSCESALFETCLNKGIVPSTLKEGLHRQDNFLGRKIVSIDILPIEQQKVYTFQTETGNYLAQNFISKNCQVESGTCSECGNKATTEKEYCDCLKKYKGKKHPRTGKKVYEKNHGIKFIELSVVGDGAFDSCMIQEIYDVDDILNKAASLDKKAESIRSTIVVASTVAPKDYMVRRAYEDCLRTAYDTTKQTLRVAQSAGTLVGGQLLAGEGAGNNTTVANILKFLGIEGTAGLNILDMLNLALNFLEVAVMNLFARKDNVDLGHVGKITKSMADLQSTMQDMIDDGVETGGDGQQPMNQGSMQQPQQPQPGPNAAQEDYTQAGAVGRSIGPQAPQGVAPGAPQGAPQTQNQAFMGMPMGFGGGIFANTNLPRVVWAHDDNEEVGRTVTASTARDTSSEKDMTQCTYNSKYVTKLAESIMNLAETLGVQTHSASPAVVSQPQPSYPKPSNQTGGNKNMDFFKQFKQARNKREAAVMEQEVKVSDKAGHSLRLSADGTIQAFYQGQLVQDFDPVLTEEHKLAIEAEDGPRVAAALLADFQRFTRTAEWKPSHEYNKTREEQLEAVRTGTDDDVKEKLLGDKAGRYNRTNEEQDIKERELGKKNLRPGTDDDVKENLLGAPAGLYSRKNNDIDVRENLINDARRGHPDDVIELQIEQVRNNYGPGDTGLVTTAAINALSKAVIEARVTPEEVVEATKSLSERNDFVELIQLAHLGDKVRRVEAKRENFWKLGSTEIASESAVLDALGSVVSAEVTAADIAECLHVVTSEVSKAIQSVTRVVKAQMGDSNGVEPSMLRKTVSKADRYRAALATIAETEAEQPMKDHIKTALFAFANSADELAAHPHEVVLALANVDESDLLADIELARSAAVRESRLQVRARRDFWGANRFASKEGVYENVVGWLADYSEAGNYSSGSIVVAAKKLVAQPVAAEKLISKVIATTTKTAAIQVTDERTSTKRLECTVGDVGLDPKDESFESAFREKAIEIMASNGYTVDPSTFTFTDLNINGDTVSASVTSTVRKTFTADAPAAGVSAEMPMEGNIDASAEVAPEPTVIMSESIKNIRIAKRQEILNRYAQAPMGGAPAGGAGAPPMGGMGGDLAGAADGLGISSFTAPTAENPEEDPANVDDMSEPGTKKPWGTICPQCGSEDVDIANGEGNCNSCNAQITYEFTAKVKPNEDKGGDDKAPAMDEPMPELGGDMGLGAATAPAPGAPAPAGAAPGPGGTAPMMMAASWKTSPDVLVRVAQLGENFNRKAEKVLPVGFVCPSCGNRGVTKVASTGRSYCYDCGTIAKSEIEERDGDIYSTISWVI